MKKITLGGLSASQMVMGCMRLAGKSEREADALVHAALDAGVNHFDHADIYGAGESEALFGRVLKANPGLREKMILQTKCGIRRGFYDFSRAHILESVDGSLARLGVERVDLLLFHRPDLLVDGEEFAEAVLTLKKQGKVGAFGVSNMNPAQIALLEAYTGEKFVCDQMQLSLMHAGLVTSCFNVNVDNAEGVVRDGGLLPYCQREKMAVQAWSPFQYGMFKGCFIGNPQFPALNAELDRLAAEYGVTPAAIAAAWILRIPGSMQVIVGTTNPEHLKEACRAGEITLERAQWYSLYRACGYELP